MLFRHGVNHLQAHVLANALGGPPVPRQETLTCSGGTSPGTGRLGYRFPLQPLSQEDGELRRIEGCFPDGGKLLDARFQDAIRPSLRTLEIALPGQVRCPRWFCTLATMYCETLDNLISRLRSQR